MGDVAVCTFQLQVWLPHPPHVAVLSLLFFEEGWRTGEWRPHPAIERIISPIISRLYAIHVHISKRQFLQLPHVATTPKMAPMSEEM